MRGIIHVLGRDRVGIIAAVCTYLAEQNINILDIQQTILKDLFTMVMIVDLSTPNHPFEETADGLEQVGRDLGLQIKLQHEDIFNAMHRV